MNQNFTKFYLFIAILLAPICSFSQGKQFTFLFPTAKANIDAIQLKEFLIFIENIKTDSFTIQGHCDSIGSIDYNQSLSELRVQSVRNFLLKNKIRKTDIKIWEGLGEMKPIVANDVEENRSKNRRVEVYINEVPEDIMQAHLKELARKTTDIKKAKFTKGEKISLPNLIFQGNRHFLTTEGEQAFLELLKKLKENSTKKIMILGHVCCTREGQMETIDLDLGTLDLSVQRAKEIYSKLIENGIDKDRLQYKGMGSLEKLYPNESTTQEQQLNRRVEIIIVN
jgi:outer membrane protein OmpA-like peptidoglycan-associated protein